MDDKKLIYDLGMLYIDVTMYLGFYLFFQSTRMFLARLPCVERVTKPFQKKRL